MSASTLKISDLPLRNASLFIMLAYPLIHAVLGPPHLYADGTNFFLNILDKQGFWAWDTPRLFAQFISQFPLVIAIKIGVRSLVALGNIYSLSLLLLPALLWICAALAQRKSPIFWRIFLAYSLVYVPGSLFSVGEFNLCYALNALIFSLLLLDCRETLPWSLLILLLSGLNALTYEVNFILALPGILLLINRIVHSASRCSTFADAPLPSFRLLGKRFKGVSFDESFLNEMPFYIIRICLLASMFFYISSLIISLASILYPRSPANASSALNISLRTYIPIVIAAMLPSLLEFADRFTKRRNLQFIFAACILAFVSYSFLFAMRPGLSYAFRIYLFIPFLICFFFPFFAARIGQRAYPINDYPTVFNYSSFLLACIFIISGLGRAHGFGMWIKQYRLELSRLEINLPFEKTQLVESNYSRYGWGWNNKQTSFILDPDSKYLIANRSDYSGFEPGLINVKMGGQKGYVK